MLIGNGDFTAFDIQEGKDISPVMYLSHDGDDFHGSCFANSFVEFITNWSNIGCIGTECWTLEIFYDKDNNKLMSDSPIIDEWKEALLKD